MNAIKASLWLGILLAIVSGTVADSVSTKGEGSPPSVLLSHDGSEGEHPSLEQVGVFILLQCDGIDVGKLSEEDDQFSARVLQDSYNEIHILSGHDDASLNHVMFEGILDDADDDEKDEGENAAILGGANLRRKKRKRPRRRMSYWGDGSCNLCPDDDKALFARLMSSGRSHRLWEKRVTESLRYSGHEDFAGCQSCKISLHSDYMPDLTNKKEATTAVAAAVVTEDGPTDEVA